MPAFESVQLAGEAMQLHADRALFWPRKSCLLIADLHLGKGDIFRRAGIALPRGGTASDLDRISDLLAATGAQTLLVLGDFLHGAAHAASWRADWSQWRQQHARLPISVIVGNHDRALANAGLDVHCVTGTQSMGPFELVHAPADAPALHQLCGHLHPVIPVPGLPRRWPAFWMRTRQTVLPAFSAFSGGFRVSPDRSETIAACVQGHVLMMPRRD